MFKIGEFSKICGLSLDALYHYEKVGILIPKSVDKFTGYRGYDASQLVTVNKILALKDAGFSLEEIAGVLNKGIAITSLITMLEDKASQLEATLANENNRLERLHTNIFLIKNGGFSHMNEITIKEIEPILVASIRKTFAKVAFDENLKEMWPRVNDYIDKNRVKRTIPCLMLYHSGWWNLADLKLEYNEHNLDVEVAEPITVPFEGSDEVSVYKLAKVEKMACIIHKGSFASISKTFDKIFEWMKQNSYVANGPIREIYHNGDWATDDPDEYVTEVQVPIR